MDKKELTQFIKAEAKSLGFMVCGIAKACDVPPEESAKKIKFAVIFNVLGTVCGFFNTLISIIAVIIDILEKM